MPDLKTVAVVGASSDRSKYSNKAIRAYRDGGWRVYPVNPKGGTIEGFSVYPTVNAIPDALDRVTLYLPPQLGVDVLDGIAAKRPGEFFVNPGAESDDLVDRARELGLEPILACSIVEIGLSPARYPDA